MVGRKQKLKNRGLKLLLCFSRKLSAAWFLNHLGWACLNKAEDCYLSALEAARIRARSLSENEKRANIGIAWKLEITLLGGERMAKGYKCPTCSKFSGVYANGVHRCTNEACSSIWWGPFDKPSAGEPRKGYRCRQCDRQTVHPVAKMQGITIWRCSTCAATLLERLDTEN